MARHEFVVGEDDIGRRLDQFLAAQLPQISRARVQELIAEGRVEVNGKSEKAALRLRQGDSIVVIGELERPPRAGRSLVLRRDRPLCRERGELAFEPRQIRRR